MDLVIWRHAEAEDETPDQDDLQRALTPRGEKQAVRMAQWLDLYLPETARRLPFPSVTASSLATLDELSGGRMDLGIGRGDSARRVLGKPPTTMATLEEAIRVIRALVAGDTIAYEGTDLHFPWTTGWDLPVWVAGYGPMALAMTGRVADGVILQLADPDLIAWFAAQVREAEAAAGRPAGSVRIQAAAPAHVGAMDLCRERTRWFPALVSNHVVDLVNKYPREALPESLTGWQRLFVQPQGAGQGVPRQVAVRAGCRGLDAAR